MSAVLDVDLKEAKNPVIREFVDQHKIVIGRLFRCNISVRINQVGATSVTFTLKYDPPAYPLGPVPLRLSIPVLIHDDDGHRVVEPVEVKSTGEVVKKTVKVPGTYSKRRYFVIADPLNEFVLETNEDDNFASLYYPTVN